MFFALRCWAAAQRIGGERSQQGPQGLDEGRVPLRLCFEVDKFFAREASCSKSSVVLVRLWAGQQVSHPCGRHPSHVVLHRPATVIRFRDFRGAMIGRRNLVCVSTPSAVSTLSLLVSQTFGAL